MLRITTLTCLVLSALASAQTKPHVAALEAWIPEVLKEENSAGVSVAFIQDFKVRWAAGFGVLVRGEDRKVDERTLFQAASISKPVTAAAVMRLVDQGVLSLDDSANSRLTSWRVPGEGAEDVTLRLLLSHRAGLTVHGFPGYSPTAKIPAVVDVLDGRASANTAAVRITTRPGSEWRYSGGGYTVAQQLLVDVAGKRFSEILKEQVLDPVGMVDSTFEQPLPKALWANACQAHGRNGQPMEDPWHLYPELAAAGLWTTPTDLARFLLAVRSALVGKGKFLSQASAREMTTPVPGSRTAVGLMVSGADANREIGHSGGNWGFKCISRLFVNRGYGVVVMTNSQNGRVLRRVSQGAYRTFVNGLPPAFDPDERAEIEVGADILKTYVGEYRLSSKVSMRVTLEKGGLHAQPTGQRKYPVFAESETKFFLKVVDAQISFTKDSGGTVDGLIWHQNRRSRRAPKVK